MKRKGLSPAGRARLTRLRISVNRDMDAAYDKIQRRAVAGLPAILKRAKKNWEAATGLIKRLPQQSRVADEAWEWGESIWKDLPYFAALGRGVVKSKKRSRRSKS